MRSFFRVRERDGKRKSGEAGKRESERDRWTDRPTDIDTCLVVTRFERCLSVARIEAIAEQKLSRSNGGRGIGLSGLTVASSAGSGQYRTAFSTGRVGSSGHYHEIRQEQVQSTSHGVWYTAQLQ